MFFAGNNGDGYMGFLQDEASAMPIDANLRAIPNGIAAGDYICNWEAHRDNIQL